jgi:hypothetical protein
VLLPVEVVVVKTGDGSDGTSLLSKQSRLLSLIFLKWRKLQKLALDEPGLCSLAA